MSAMVAPNSEEVRSVLERILASARFVRSRRASQLLSYLVEATLSGRGEAIKAFSIAVDVFGKDQSFDADNDTLVRVQAGRLRGMLESYFEGEGRDSPVVIQMPRGGYLLHFIARPADSVSLSVGAGGLPIMARAQTPAFQLPGGSAPPQGGASPPPSRWSLARWPIKIAAIGLLAVVALGLHFYREAAPRNTAKVARPAVIRLLVADRDAKPSERVILHAVREIAARFTLFDTVTREDAQDRISKPTPEDYRIRIEEAQSGDSNYIFLSAEHLASGVVVGAERTTLRPKDPMASVLPIEQALIRLLQPLGPIYADYRRRGDFSPVMRCVLLTQDFIPDQTDERHEKARQCTEELIAKGVEDARIYTALSFLHMEEYTDQRNLRPGDPLKRAIAASQRALELAPNDSEAHQQLMAVYVLTGDFDQMMAEGHRSIALNPSNSAMLDNFAARINRRGQYEEAVRLLLRAEELQPVAPRWRAYAFFLAYYGQGRMKEAMERAATLVGSENPLYIAARIIVARYKGDVVERNEALIALAREERGFLKNPRAIFERRHYLPDLIDRLVEDITAADVAAGPARVRPMPGLD